PFASPICARGSSPSTASTTIPRRRTSRSSKPSRWRGTKSSRTPRAEGQDMSLGGMFRPGMRGYLVPLAAGVALSVSAFLAWEVVGEYSQRGVADVWGLWVAALGALAAVLATLSMITRKNARHP